MYDLLKNKCRYIYKVNEKSFDTMLFCGCDLRAKIIAVYLHGFDLNRSSLGSGKWVSRLTANGTGVTNNGAFWEGEQSAV